MMPAAWPLGLGQGSPAGRDTAQSESWGSVASCTARNRICESMHLVRGVRASEPPAGEALDYPLLKEKKGRFFQ